MTTSRTLKINWTDHLGNAHTHSRDIVSAQQRLAHLDRVEKYTQIYCPTDSGHARMDFISEASALRGALAQWEA